MKRCKGFTIVCDKCGSYSCDIMQDSIEIKIYCYNQDCLQEETIIEEVN